MMGNPAEHEQLRNKTISCNEEFSFLWSDFSQKTKEDGSKSAPQNKIISSCCFISILRDNDY